MFDDLVAMFDQLNRETPAVEPKPSTGSRLSAPSSTCSRDRAR